MTFEEWNTSKDAHLTHNRRIGWDAGQESLRPLVEKMRTDLAMVKRLIEYGDGDVILAGSAGHKMITESVDEADKFLGGE